MNPGRSDGSRRSFVSKSSVRRSPLVVGHKLFKGKAEKSFRRQYSRVDWLRRVPAETTTTGDRTKQG
jgi:hypothetical protein